MLGGTNKLRCPAYNPASGGGVNFVVVKYTLPYVFGECLGITCYGVRYNLYLFLILSIYLNNFFLYFVIVK